MGFDRMETPRPCLFFVHDNGVYLMSNGEPRDLLDPADPQSSAYVVYAEQCNPTIDDDWWENSRDLVGGDDFVEALPIAEDWLKLCDECKEFILHVSPTEILGQFV
jgi:hypothetical protein